MKHVTVLLAALVLVLGTHAVTRADPPAAAPAGVQKWEYKLLQYADAEGGGATGAEDVANVQAAMNKFGDEGWELVEVSVMEKGTLIFKRPKR